VHFNVSVTSRDLQTSRLGLVSNFQRLVSVSSRLVRPTSQSRSRPLTSSAHPCSQVLYQYYTYKLIQSEQHVALCKHSLIYVVADLHGLEATHLNPVVLHCIHNTANWMTSSTHTSSNNPLHSSQDAVAPVSVL